MILNVSIYYSLTRFIAHVVPHVFHIGRIAIETHNAKSSIFCYLFSQNDL